jgi:hypothetical protein
MNINYLGDAGGNLFKIDHKFNTLHWLWDEAMATTLPTVQRVLILSKKN